MKQNSPRAKKLLLLFGIFCIVIICLAACTQKEIKNIDSAGKNIICFGDSITFGYGAEEGQDFPRLLSRMTEIPVINSGLDGDDTISALKRLENDVLDREPLLVVIEFGGNDFLRKVTLEDTLKNIEEMIKAIHTAGAMVAVADISMGIIMNNYSSGFRKLSKKHQVIYIPNLLKGIITDASLRSDFIHPNASGYKVIAHRIYRAIIPYLNRNTMLRKFKK